MFTQRRTPILAWLATAASCALLTSPAFAQADYKDKTLTIIASVTAGGPIDTNARWVGRYIARYIPGHPTIVVRNMPGGGHTLATNYLFNNAPRDGTTIGTFINAIPLHQATGGAGVRFDAARFSWIGSTGVTNLVTFMSERSGVRSIDEVFKREVVVGATGASAGNYLYPRVLNHLLGARFKIITGYTGIPDLDLAISRGEIGGRAGASYASLLQEHPQDLKEGKLIPILQVGAVREKDLPDVPLMHELTTDPTLVQVLELISSPVLVGRPFAAPPDTPSDRLGVLRRAFDAVMANPEARAEAAKLHIDLNPITGEQLGKVVSGILGTPRALLDKAIEAMGPPEGAPARK
jgi:tripartite-type tricarboxylate transporter receptor subunit TctC